MADEQTAKTCGNCENYCQYGMWGELEGLCRVIPGDLPGQPGKRVRFDTDGSQCPKWEKLAFVYTDASQVHADSHLRVYGGYTDDSKSDRLVWEKHSEKTEGKDDK
ncbi:MAG: hypothetical protein SVY53_00605 [Chloroflexota bacterium]|nr:hypothetical protein [Chloroflexota bacterium]